MANSIFKPKSLTKPFDHNDHSVHKNEMEENLFHIKIASETTNLDIGDIEGQFLEN